MDNLGNLPPSDHTCRICISRIDTSTNARPISPPESRSDGLGQICYVEFQGRVYQVSWTNTTEYPDLSHFPFVEGTVHQVELSTEMAAVLSASVLLDYGSNGHIRCTHSDLLPVIKMAHPNQLSRARIRHEWQMLDDLALNGVPVPSFDRTPLIDGAGMFGYRMEFLSAIDLKGLGAIAEDVTAIVKHLHERGFCHGDLTPSNVMRNMAGRLVLIDLSNSGPLDTTIQWHVPINNFAEGVFSVDIDHQYLKNFFK